MTNFDLLLSENQFSTFADISYIGLSMEAANDSFSEF